MKKLFALTILALVLVACAAPTPTPTPVPPTATRVPPTATPVPPTATPVPPTATPVPPTATRVPPTATATPPKEVTVTLTFLGHPTFILKTSTGLTALLDPMATTMGYTLTPISGVDLVTVSHEHADHNNVSLATGTPTILRGLAAGDWAKIDQTIKGVRVYTVPTYHDDSQGSARGKNAVFVFDVEGLRLAHLGDLGHKLNDDQVKQIGKVDVVMIPVGGFFTLDGKGAAEVVGQLKPKIVIPMHYATPALNPATAQRLTDTAPFISALGASAKVTQAPQTITVSSLQLPTELTVMVMSYK
ncbi:MAG: MBL fold metallo-hydrolase [Anaerolineae bacterium]|nr:MBL fold metallo-hydrolase [Anaerolineae bacterium]